MAITITYRASVYSTTSSSSYAASGTYTPAIGSILVAFVVGTMASSPADPIDVTGHGRPFTQIPLTANTLSTTHILSVWALRVGAGNSSSATTVTFGSSQTGCAIIEFEITGADIGGLVENAIIQQPTNNGTGTTGTVTLASPANSNNRPLSFFVHLANEATTFRTNWTETTGADGNFNNPATGAEAQFRNDAFETTASATWSTSSAWRGVALEIRNQATQNLTSSMSTMSGTTTKTASKVYSAATSTMAATFSRVDRHVISAAMSTFVGSFTRRASKVLTSAWTTLSVSFTGVKGSSPQVYPSTLTASTSTFDATTTKTTQHPLSGTTASWVGTVAKMAKKIFNVT